MASSEHPSDWEGERNGNQLGSQVKSRSNQSRRRLIRTFIVVSGLLGVVFAQPKLEKAGYPTTGQYLSWILIGIMSIVVFRDIEEYNQKYGLEYN